MDRFFLVDKAAGVTSSQLVQKLKSKLNLKKLGHTGTLDKFAEGLLILPSGKACSLAQKFLSMDKTYRAQLNLGISTDSGDPEGNLILDSREKLLHVWKEDWNEGELLRRAILNLKNLTNQTAPIVSALKFKGKRLSDYHRAGVAVEPKVRSIRVHRVEIREFRPELVEFDISVSSGTYIRKMAMDLGETLGFPISLSKLIRLRVGNFSLDKSKPWEAIHSDDGITMKEAMGISCVLVGEEKKSWIKNGRIVGLPEVDWVNLKENEEFFLVDSEGQELAWCEKKNTSEWNYIRVFV